MEDCNLAPEDDECAVDELEGVSDDVLEWLSSNPLKDILDHKATAALSKVGSAKVISFKFSPIKILTWWIQVFCLILILQKKQDWLHFFCFNEFPPLPQGVSIRKFKTIFSICTNSRTRKGWWVSWFHKLDLPYSRITECVEIQDFINKYFSSHEQTPYFFLLI